MKIRAYLRYTFLCFVPIIAVAVAGAFLINFLSANPIAQFFEAILFGVIISIPFIKYIDYIAKKD